MGAKPSLSCEINDLLHDGRGVGRINGKAFFVEGALPGEEVEFRVINEKRNFAEARLTKVLSASQYRTEPECRYFSKCGGCSLQHLQHSEQVEFKKQQLLNNVQRVGTEARNHPRIPRRPAMELSAARAACSSEGERRTVSGRLPQPR